MEIWKDINGFEGLYQVSNCGNVKSLRSGKDLSFTFDEKGYKTVHLCKGKTDKRIRVHRLVAEAFISNPQNLPCVNHKDENKQNNFVENLEWCSVDYNNNYGSRNKRISVARKKQMQRIYQFSIDGTFLREWENITEINSELNICKSGVYRCCEGIYKQAGGYVWKYEKSR